MSDRPPLYENPSVPIPHPLHATPRIQRVQGYAMETLAYHHNEALWVRGEPAVFVLLWTLRDFTQNYVDRCPTCYEVFEEVSDAYGQGAQEDCPDCLGTTFEGGYRAIIVRPSLWNATDDRNEDEERRGGTVMATAVVQSTGDFTLRKGDFIIRSGGSRWRVEETDTPPVLTGFGDKGAKRHVMGLSATRVVRQDESSIIYSVGPSLVELAVLNGPFDIAVQYSSISAALEDIRGPLE